MWMVPKNVPFKNPTMPALCITWKYSINSNFAQQNCCKNGCKETGEIWWRLHTRGCHTKDPSPSVAWQLFIWQRESWEILATKKIMFRFRYEYNYDGEGPSWWYNAVGHVDKCTCQIFSCETWLNFASFIFCWISFLQAAIAALLSKHQSSAKCWKLLAIANTSLWTFECCTNW